MSLDRRPCCGCPHDSHLFLFAFSSLLASSGLLMTLLGSSSLPQIQPPPCVSHGGKKPTSMTLGAPVVPFAAVDWLVLSKYRYRNWSLALRPRPLVAHDPKLSSRLASISRPCSVTRKVIGIRDACCITVVTVRLVAASSHLAWLDRLASACRDTLRAENFHHREIVKYRYFWDRASCLVRAPCMYLLNNFHLMGQSPPPSLLSRNHALVLHSFCSSHELIFILF
ncbi:hypothetical protein B0I35DRAFT_220685 [Stachybotrys elegans]|uniref:Uncharacterized protein n=1 Tax=Stachybotrys elegans TaxID=80388 RepID=A0A8K0WSF2_9HYPO|nr:hypothetical protein B0I35DRAFT_220685 [Stachybotrys elegans]